MKKNLKVVSLFSGIGGFEEGFKKSNIKYDVVFSSEIDKYATTTYGYNFSLDQMHGDVKLIDENDIPEHDLLFGGFPCQSFSVAGKQKGFNDIRGTLFFDVVRIIKKKKPKFILLENVKNLISHDSSNTIKTILKNISDCGYTFDITVINSSEAGVPQNRERTYIVGVLNYNTEKFEEDKRNVKINTIKYWANENNLKTMNFFNKINIKRKISYISDILEKDVDRKYFIENDKVRNFINLFKEDKLNTEKTNKIIKIFDLPKEVHNDLERQRRVYSINGISPTILARSDSPKIVVKINNQYEIRKLTPIETLKSQGFSEEFVQNVKKYGMSDTQLYKQAGNAVSPPVITEIINAMMELLHD